MKSVAPTSPFSMVGAGCGSPGAWGCSSTTSGPPSEEARETGVAPPLIATFSTNEAPPLMATFSTIMASPRIAALAAIVGRPAEATCEVTAVASASADASTTGDAFGTRASPILEAGAGVGAKSSRAGGVASPVARSWQPSPGLAPSGSKQTSPN